LNRPKDRGRRAPRTAEGNVVRLAAEREKPVLRRHPWIFSGAVDSIGKDIEDGGVADVVSAVGSFVARGMVNRRSQIVVRLLTFDEDERDEPALVARRIASAVARRPPNESRRLVFAESDGLPGLIVDRYADFLVVQLSALGMEAHRDGIVKTLVEHCLPRGIYERSDVDGREKEGLERRTGLLFGEEPPELVSVRETTHDGRDVALLVDVRRGQKTGAYLDQRESRTIVGAVSNGARVLNVFSFAGAFGIHAAAGGATEVVNVDSSADALALSEKTANENGFASRTRHVRADAFGALRRFRDEGETFDVVVVDPPKLAQASAHVDRAARAYKDLSRVAFSLVRPGGYLATFSCSGAISTDLFRKIVWSASLEAGRDAQIVRHFHQPDDHPVLLTFPEGEYLKGLLCRAL
jgi:23S rRNA (cytosine1962-C5)-methyltransferase